MKNILLLLGFMVVVSNLNAKELKAFPTAEGFGKYSVGGRGGHVVTVTSLEDDSLGVTEGTFRWVLNQYDSDFTIVFAVSGEIHLVRDIRAEKTNLTIAGQTAPGDGVYFSGAALNFGGSRNLIIRHIRSRVGCLDANGEVMEDNAFIANNIRNLMIDHCSFGWSVEENINVYDAKFITVQWSIVHEGLYNAGHKKGVRSYATQWGGTQSTYHHNLLAHHNSRSPRFNGATSNDKQVFIEYINNVNYNWASNNACYGGENSGGSQSIHEVNMVNNYYKPGPATDAFVTSLYFVMPSYSRDGEYSNGPASWHIDGNVMEGNQEITNNNWLGVNLSDVYSKGGYTEEMLRIDTLIIPQSEPRQNVNKFEYYGYSFEEYTYADYESAEDAYNSVLDHVGAFPRDVVDSRIIEEVRTGTASGIASNPTYTESSDSQVKENKFYGKELGIIDVPEDVGGYPVYTDEYEVPLDSDGDGIPDEWEEKYGLDPNNPEDGNYVNSIGYTALEIYLNWLTGEETDEDIAGYVFEEPTSISQYEAVSTPLALVSTVVDKELLLESAEGLKQGAIYNMNGVRYMNFSAANLSSSIYVEHLPEGLYILVVSTKEGQTKSVRFLKK